MSNFFKSNSFPPDSTLQKFFKTADKAGCCIPKVTEDNLIVGQVCVTNESGNPTFTVGVREQPSTPITSADILHTTWGFVQTNDLTRPITIHETESDEFTGPRVHGFVQAISFLGATRPLLYSYGPAFNRLQHVNDLNFSWVVTGGGGLTTVTIDPSTIGLENIASGFNIWQADDPTGSVVTVSQVVRETNSLAIDTSSLDSTVPWGVEVVFPNPDDLNLANPASLNTCGGVVQNFSIIQDPQSNPSS